MNERWRAIRWKAKKSVLVFLMRQAGLRGWGRCCARLAGSLVGPYKDKKVLANLTDRPYISPRAQLQCARLQIGNNAFIDDNVTIYGHDDGAGIFIGERVHIHRGTILEVGAGGKIVIGADTHIQANCNLKAFLCDLVIGEQVQLAPQCALSPYEHGFEDISRPMREQPIHSKGPIVLEDDVWLGVGVRVLDGVTIGQGAVVGAGAVVTKDIPPLGIAVGMPARVIRWRGGQPGGR